MRFALKKISNHIFIINKQQYKISLRCWSGGKTISAFSTNLQTSYNQVIIYASDWKQQKIVSMTNHTYLHRILFSDFSQLRLHNGLFFAISDNLFNIYIKLRWKTITKNWLLGFSPSVFCFFANKYKNKIQLNITFYKQESYDCDTGQASGEFHFYVNCQLLCTQRQINECFALNSVYK